MAIAVFGFAPDFRSSRTNSKLPFVHACDNGVIRKSLAVFASAPAFSSSSAVSASFQCASQSSAVEPSLDRALTSAF